MNKKLVAAAVAALVLIAGAYFGSPYWAARQFREAAVSGDIDRLEAAVDFPAVRESLKAQLTVILTEKMNSDPEMKSNPFAGLAMMMMPTMINGAIDSFVTPDGISAMMKKGKVERNRHAAVGAQVDANLSYSYDYRGTDRFAVTPKSPTTPAEEAPSFVFERRGWFSWKVIRLEIPADIFEGMKAGAKP